MRVKTDGYIGNTPGAASTASAKAREAQARSTQEAGGALGESNESVKVTVSARARELAATQQADHVNEAKVVKLRTAIEDGTFKVDAHKIAQKLVDGDGDPT